MEGSKAVRVEDEDSSSSSWMQMAEVMKMRPEAAQEMQEGSLKPEEGSLQAEKNDSSSLLLEQFDESGSSEQMSHKRIKRKEEAMEFKENYNLSSWVVEMEKINTSRSTEQAHWLRPSIYRVPEWLNRMTKREAYQPQVVSLGPFHHGKLHLQPMEEHKRRLMLHMVSRSGKPFAQFVEAIKDVAEKLQDAYDGLEEEWCGGENTDRFVEVMVTDGAFLLEMMSVVTSARLPADYAPCYDPIFGRDSILSLWVPFQSDIILVENQVPLLALHTLEAVRRGAPPVRIPVS